jgi:hypothetical protein
MFDWINWDAVLSVVVIFHVTCEFAHYLLEYFWGRKEGSVLLDILTHRKQSQKTALLRQIRSNQEVIMEYFELEPIELKELTEEAED